jgi:hypothetical protein
VIRRIAAIVITDVRIRFRRPSTAILFLLLSACAYMWVPAPSTGRTLLQIDGQRALYNSAAVGMGTASLATIFIGLVGFYVISNALRRDVETRCGFVLASTGMRGGEYLAGKFAGNLAFLVTFIGGFMGSAMIMQLLRGEAPLQPIVFATQYVVLVLPGMIVVAAIAILFESVPLLRGRFGDVVYFFVWMASIGVVASMTDPKGSTPIGWISIFDISGTGYLFESLRTVLHTNRLSIGASDFDPRKGVFVFGGLPVSLRLLLPRIGTCLLAIPILGVASLFFHRFDPARVRVTEKSKRNWLGRLNALAKPFARLMFAFAPSGGRASFARSVVLDAMLTISAMPIAFVAIIVLNVVVLVSPMRSVTSGVLSIVFGALAIAIADVASREARVGTTTLVRAAPQLRERFVAWKLASSLLIGVVFFAGAIVRFAAARPASLVPLIIGIVFVCAAATMLGVVSANPKAFVVAFLLFWYIAMNDKGATAALDYAGLNGSATPLVVASYAAIAVAFVVSAAAFHAFTLRRS